MILRSKKTVKPSFNQKWVHEALVTRLPDQLCAISCACQKTGRSKRGCNSMPSRGKKENKDVSTP